MAKNSTLAIDSATGEPVHIEDVPEGFRNAICCDCEKPLVSSNRNRSSRQVAQYFRHEGNQGNNCSNMSALHLYSQRLLQDRCEVTLPSFHYPPTANPGVIPAFEISSYLATIQDAKLEEPYPVASRLIADVAGTEIESGRIYFEIWVHHKVGASKSEALMDEDLDVVEIDLGSLIDRQNLRKKDIEEAVVFSAPRKWIAHARFKREIERLTDSAGEPTSVSATEIALLESYSKVENRQAALVKFENWLERKGAPGNQTFEALGRTYSMIPSEVNVPVPHELAFKVHRIHWQTQIFLRLQNHCDALRKQSKTRGLATLRALMPEHFLDDKIDLADIYKQLIGSGIELTSVSQAFEFLAKEPLPESFEDRPRCLEAMERDTYTLIPKPLVAIGNYLRALGQNGLLAHCGGSYWVTQRQLGFDDPSFGPTKISSEGKLQYAPETEEPVELPKSSGHYRI